MSATPNSIEPLLSDDDDLPAAPEEAPEVEGFQFQFQVPGATVIGRPPIKPPTIPELTRFGALTLNASEPSNPGLGSQPNGIESVPMDPQDERIVDLANDADRARQLGRDADAASGFAEALAIEEARAESDPHTIATLLHNIGGLDDARRRFTEAEANARRDLALRRSNASSDDHDVARDEGALAAVLVDLDHLDEAISLATRAEEGHYRSERRRHSGESRAAYARALAILEDAGLADHPYRPRIEQNMERLTNR